MKPIFTLILAMAAILAAMAATPAPADSRPDPRAESLKRLEARADSGSAQAQFALSMLYEDGREGYPKDAARALQLIRSAAAQAYAPACNYLGFSYLNGALGLHQSADSALLWIERAATAPEPDPKAFNNLGMLLLTGDGGVRQDYAKARYWLQRGADRGLPTSQASLAQMYLYGIGVEQDSARAQQLLHTAARAGMLDAALQLRELTRAQTDTLGPQAALDLGLQYYRDKIYPLSAPLFRQASDGGNAYATALLAQAYAEGLGVHYDYPMALALYTTAAMAGDPSAMYILAEALEQFPDLLQSPQFTNPDIVDPTINPDHLTPAINPTHTPAMLKDLTPDQLREAAAAQGIATAQAALLRLHP